MNSLHPEKEISRDWARPVTIALRKVRNQTYQQGTQGIAIVACYSPAMHAYLMAMHAYIYKVKVYCFPALCKLSDLLGFQT